MKIAVCDDENFTVREQVSDIIKTYFDERKRNVNRRYMNQAGR